MFSIYCWSCPADCRSRLCSKPFQKMVSSICRPHPHVTCAATWWLELWLLNC